MALGYFMDAQRHLDMSVQLLHRILQEDTEVDHDDSEGSGEEDQHEGYRSA
jgi:hypothetical protein